MPIYSRHVSNVKSHKSDLCNIVTPIFKNIPTLKLLDVEFMNQFNRRANTKDRRMTIILRQNRSKINNGYDRARLTSKV